jgi:hypothetical protein
MSTQIDRLMQRVAFRSGLVRHKDWKLRDGSARCQTQNGCGHAPDNASGRRQRTLFTQPPGNPSSVHHLESLTRKTLLVETLNPYAQSKRAPRLRNSPGALQSMTPT